MSLKIDDKDRSIIKQLQTNARQTISQIAKKTRLPRDVVKYRIDRMEKNGLIKQYQAILDPLVLGYSLYAYVGFSLQNISPQEEKALIGFLVANKNISFVGKSSGKYDLLIAICARNYQEFDNILQGIRQRFGKEIKEFDATPLIKSYKYDWLADLV
jgi:DNA-binding Lrp family transcriptional regulator